MAPAARAISAVRSVELLSHTISSKSQPRRANTMAADFICVRDAPSNRSSLKAGTMIDIFKAAQLALFTIEFQWTNPRKQPEGRHRTWDCGDFDGDFCKIRLPAGRRRSQDGPRQVLACFFRQMVFIVVYDHLDSGFAFADIAGRPGLPAGRGARGFLTGRHYYFR